MTLKIGCFGSVLTFSPKLEVCIKCEIRDACAKTVFEREAKVTELLTLRETERGKKSADEIESKALDDTSRYFQRRRKLYARPKAPTKSRAEKDYEAMIERGIDFARMRDGENPISADAGLYGFVRNAINVMLRERVFSARDIQEHLIAIGECSTASTARVYANRALSIVSQSGQITKEGKVYCLAT